MNWEFPTPFVHPDSRGGRILFGALRRIWQVQVLLGCLGFAQLLVAFLGMWPILGVDLFAANRGANLVHLLGGVATFWALWNEFRRYQIIFTLAVAYGVLAVMGLVIPTSAILGFIEVNFADNLLHAGLAILFFLASWRLPKN